MFSNKRKKKVILKTKNYCPTLSKPKLSINSQLILFLQNFFFPNLGNSTSFLKKKYVYFVPIRIACLASEWGLFNPFLQRCIDTKLRCIYYFDDQDSK